MYIVWTNHLEERLKQRGISKNEAFDTIKYPEKSIKLSANKWKFFKVFSHKQVVIVAVYEHSQWIILTAWTKSPQYQAKVAQEPLINRLITKLLINFVEGVGKLLGR